MKLSLERILADVKVIYLKLHHKNQAAEERP